MTTFHILRFETPHMYGCQYSQLHLLVVAFIFRLQLMTEHYIPICLIKELYLFLVITNNKEAYEHWYLVISDKHWIGIVGRDGFKEITYPKKKDIAF